MNKDVFDEVQKLRESFVAAYSDWTITKYSRRELRNVMLVKKRAERLSEALASLPVLDAERDGL